MPTESNMLLYTLPPTTHVYPVRYGPSALEHLKQTGPLGDVLINTAIVALMVIRVLFHYNIADQVRPCLG